MQIIGLDVSTKTGYAVIDEEKTLIKYGLCVTNMPKQVDPFQLITCAELHINDIIKSIKPYLPAYIIVEQTNPSRHQTQRLLEYLHCVLVQQLRRLKLQQYVRYVYTSEWRHALRLRLSRQQKSHNRQVSSGRLKGRITSKHLSVDFANKTFNATFKLKDHNICDAINIAYYGAQNLFQ